MFLNGCTSTFTSIQHSQCGIIQNVYPVLLSYNKFMFHFDLAWAENSVELTAVHSNFSLVLHETGYTGGFMQDGFLSAYYY